MAETITVRVGRRALLRLGFDYHGEPGTIREKPELRLDGDVAALAEVKDIPNEVWLRGLRPGQTKLHILPGTDPTEQARSEGKTARPDDSTHSDDKPKGGKSSARRGAREFDVEVLDRDEGVATVRVAGEEEDPEAEGRDPAHPLATVIEGDESDYRSKVSDSHGRLVSDAIVHHAPTKRDEGLDSPQEQARKQGNPAHEDQKVKRAEDAAKHHHADERTRHQAEQAAKQKAGSGAPERGSPQPAKPVQSQPSGKK